MSPTGRLLATLVFVVGLLLSVAVPASATPKAPNAGTASAGAAAPKITAVHFSNIGPNMRIEVDGSGFGAPAVGLPYIGTVPNFEFQDLSRGDQ